MASLRVLLVEDNPGDAGLIEAMLDDEGADVHLTHVESLDAAVQAMQGGSHDAVLLDLSLPDSDGVESVATAHFFDTGVPIIVLTGLDSEEVAFEAVRAGAQDYLVKGTIDGASLLRTLRFAMERHTAQTTLQAQAGEIQEGHVEAMLCSMDASAAVCRNMLHLLEDGPVLYVAVDRSASDVQARFDEAGVPLGRVHFIDATGTDAPGDRGHVHVQEDPRDLGRLALDVELACAALGPSVRVVLDSVNALLVRHRVDGTVAFLHTLTNRLRALGLDSFLVAKDTADWPFLADRLTFLDRVVPASLEA